MITIKEQEPVGTLAVREGEEIELVLSENPSTGFEWQFDFPKSRLQLLSDELKGGTQAVGGAMQRVVRLLAVDAGIAQIPARYQRAFQPEPAKIREFSLRIS